MKKYIFNTINAVVLLFIILAQSSCNNESKFVPTVTCEDEILTPKVIHPKKEKIQNLIDDYIQRGVPGTSVLISDDNGLWYGSSGYADISNGIKMQPCHINKLGSVTKMMVGSVIWLLVQEGKLEIDAPIKTYIPDVADKITNGNEITLKMLLNHTSGIAEVGADLSYNLAVINDFDRSWTPEEILEFIEEKTPTNAPGEAVSYSNTNTLLESLIIEKVTGKTTNENLIERLFVPLEMAQTVYYDFSEDFPHSNVAQGYLDVNNDGGSIQNISDLNPGSGNGYTGVFSTVTDLFKFMEALLREKTIISPDNLDYIFANMEETKSGNWKTSPAGIHQEFIEHLPEGIKTFGHAGGDIGYSANLNYFPHNNTITAISINYGTNLPSELAKTVHEMRAELMKIMAE